MRKKGGCVTMMEGVDRLGMCWWRERIGTLNGTCKCTVSIWGVDNRYVA